MNMLRDSMGSLWSGWKLFCSPLVMKDFIRAQGDEDIPAWVSFGTGLLGSAGELGAEGEGRFLPQGLSWVEEKRTAETYM